ncbi:MAG: molybdate ABC transporter substrate-binding protein [Hydrococcus sp. Prado102]|jgi:molybdate transport system substrate-binding protein|nr:molybdate ABC transporter substrate-binding protein [Hydrococcus sp. Prado102]
MKRKHVFAFVLSLVATVILATGLQFFTSTASFAQGNATVLVSAAASLQDALEELDPVFENAHSGTTVNYNFGSSGALQQQIEQGAPADIFFSAATKQMDALQEKNLILPDTRRNLLTNRLVLIVPSNSTLGVNSFSQLSESNVKRIAIGEPRSVPVGQYSEELFAKMGILDQIKAKFVYGNSVRNVLAAVESGNADAGIVYTTDAKISDKVKQVATAPEDMHSPIVYPIAVLKSSKNPEAAKTYEQFLSSSEAKTTFEKFGFGIAQ